MTKTHVVQSGDTLSSIAQKLGTSVSNLEGFRSGDANLIFPGETISVKAPTNSEATDRASVVRDELGEGPDTTTTLDEAPDADTGGFDFSKLESNLNDAKEKREEAFNKLDGFRTDRYDELVSERALNDKKDEIASLDDQIAELKTQRDDSIKKIRSNPGASAATLAGDVAKATDQLNANINNLIDQRNSVAGEYNTELSEIERLVANEASDLEASLGFFDTSVSEAQGLLDAYQSALVDQLTREEDRENDLADDLRDFEQALELARIKGSDSGVGTNYTILTDQFGRPTVAIDKNNPTNQIDVSGNEGSLPKGGTDPALLQAQAQASQESNEPGAIGKAWDWVTGWFN